jgi:hypothetical protein
VDFHISLEETRSLGALYNMWWFVVALVVSMVVSYAMQPKPQAQPPAGLGEFNVPTAEVGREIPVLFGTRDMSGPNVVWYGDLRTEAVKS